MSFIPQYGLGLQTMPRSSIFGSSTPFGLSVMAGGGPATRPPAGAQLFGMGQPPASAMGPRYGILGSAAPIRVPRPAVIPVAREPPEVSYDFAEIGFQNPYVSEEFSYGFNGFGAWGGFGMGQNKHNCNNQQFATGLSTYFQYFGPRMRAAACITDDWKGLTSAGSEYAENRFLSPIYGYSSPYGGWAMGYNEPGYGGWGAWGTPRAQEDSFTQGDILDEDPNYLFYSAQFGSSEDNDFQFSIYDSLELSLDGGVSISVLSNDANLNAHRLEFDASFNPGSSLRNPEYLPYYAGMRNNPANQITKAFGYDEFGQFHISPYFLTPAYRGNVGYNGGYGPIAGDPRFLESYSSREDERLQQQYLAAQEAKKAQEAYEEFLNPSSDEEEEVVDLDGQGADDGSDDSGYSSEYSSDYSSDYSPDDADDDFDAYEDWEPDFSRSNPFSRPYGGMPTLG